MNNILMKKIREAMTSVLPVTAIVFILNLTPLVNLSAKELIVFLSSALFLILGIGMFSLGADLAMKPPDFPVENLYALLDEMYEYTKGSAHTVI